MSTNMIHDREDHGPGLAGTYPGAGARPTGTSPTNVRNNNGSSISNGLA